MAPKLRSSTVNFGLKVFVDVVDIFYYDPDTPIHTIVDVCILSVVASNCNPNAFFLQIKRIDWDIT